LLGSDEADRFLAHGFGQDRWRTRTAPGASGLFDWDRLNAALAEHRLEPPRLRLERAGADVTRGVFRSRRTRRGALLQDLDTVVLTERLREGATLIIDAVNEISAPLQALCADLSADFTAACQANLYACWGETQGFNAHWDDHEVFVVQAAGRKTWSLHGCTEPWPTRRGAGRDAPPPDAPPEVVVLEPGDVLYLPRGYWHAAVGMGEPSLHLTIGLTRKAGADLVHWLADDLLDQPAFRADLPFDAGEAALTARVAGILAELARRDPAELARRYRRHVEAALPQRPQPAFPYIAADGADLAQGALVRIAAGAARLRSEPGGLVLSWRGVEFTLAPGLEAAIRRLLAGEALSLAELTATAAPSRPDAVQAFVREMGRRGVFVIQGGFGA
jgi:hypothetical protein